MVVVVVIVRIVAVVIVVIVVIIAIVIVCGMGDERGQTRTASDTFYHAVAYRGCYINILPTANKYVARRCKTR